MPIGSKFSIEQIIMQLSSQSLTTSISYSFQPIRDSSIKSSLVGDSSSPFSQIFLNSAILYAIPPPVPPIVKEGLIIQGKPIFFWTSKASLIECAIPEVGVSRLIAFMVSSKSCLSSALSIAVLLAPIRITLCFFRIPFLSNVNAVFRAVWPPIVGRIASGDSFSIIFSTDFQWIGSMYVASASRGSVIMVAGFEFTSITLKPSSFKALHA